MARPWVLKEALAMVGAIYTDVQRFGYHITFGGDILRRGVAQNESIDLFFHPIEDKKSGKIHTDQEGLMKWMNSLWGHAYPMGALRVEGRREPNRLIDPDDEPPIAAEAPPPERDNLWGGGIGEGDPFRDRDRARRAAERAGLPVPAEPKPLYTMKLQYRRPEDIINVYIL